MFQWIASTFFWQPSRAPKSLVVDGDLYPADWTVEGIRQVHLFHRRELANSLNNRRRFVFKKWLKPKRSKCLLKRGPEKAIYSYAKNFKPREGDVVVVTFPRSGTTWTQYVCHKLLVLDGAKISLSKNREFLYSRWWRLSQRLAIP